MGPFIRPTVRVNVCFIKYRLKLYKCELFTCTWFSLSV